MATKQRDEQDAATPEPKSAPEAELVIAYRCPSHETFFPNEDPILPYTAFKTDPVTRFRVHDRSCQRCTAARRQGLLHLSPVERVRVAQKQVAREYQRLVNQGKRDSAEAAAASAHLKFLNQQLYDLTRTDKEGAE